jgi:hypothetical protein
MYPKLLCNLTIVKVYSNAIADSYQPRSFVRLQLNNTCTMVDVPYYYMPSTVPLKGSS